MALFKPDVGTVYYKYGIGAKNVQIVMVNVVHEKHAYSCKGMTIQVMQKELLRYTCVSVIYLYFLTDIKHGIEVTRS